MAAYAFRRILVMVPLLWAIATLTFFLMHAVPGGPFDREQPLPEATQLALARKYHLDDSLLTQYRNFLSGLTQGDLGLSFAQNRPVTEILSDGLWTTVQLGLLAFLFAMLLGLGFGILSAVYQNGPLDYLGVFISTIGAAVPNFVIAIFLVVFLALEPGWFNVIGWRVWEIGPLDIPHYRTATLPTIALGLLPGAFIARITRAAMLEVLHQDYIRAARARGLSGSTVVLRHAVRNALIPVLTVAGPILAGLITGSFIIEQVFQIPGIGREYVSAVFSRDYGMIMGTTLLFAAAIAVTNLAVDLIYGLIDPRIRYE